MEEAKGAPDEEARTALRRLQSQMAELEAARAGHPSSCPVQDDTTVARQLDALQERLGSLERRVGELPPEAQGLLAGAADALFGAGTGTVPIEGSRHSIEKDDNQENDVN